MDSFYSEQVPRKINLQVWSIYELLGHSAFDYPDRLAVIDNQKQLTYSQLKQEVDSFASALHRRMFRKGDRIALMLPNCVEYIIAFYAAQRLGGTVVQVNPLYQSVELEHILRDAKPKWFVCQQKQVEKLKQIGWVDSLKVIVADGEVESLDGMSHWLKDGQDYLPPLTIDPMVDVAVLQYTGGTTGRSKGVMLTHSNIVSNIQQTFDVFSTVLKRSEECLLGVAPLTHAMAMTNVNFSIFIAATFVILEKFEKTKVLEAIRKYRPTMFLGSPTMYIAILHHPDLKKGDLSSLKICNSGSAPMPVEVMMELERKSGAKIFEGYGLSEATTATHRTPVTGKRKIGSVGIPLPNTAAKIVDVETGMIELPYGEAGELIVKGPQVMKGYWNNPEETSQALRDGWLYTGDIAMKDEDGYYFIVGRKKEMIVSGGLNIYPSEVEEVLYQHPAVMEACVFGVPDSYLGEKVKAVVVLQKDGAASAEELLEWCSQRIARYKVPRLLEFQDALPKTIVGKILRRNLKEEHNRKCEQLS